MRKKLYLLPGTMCNQKLWLKVLPYLHGSPELVYLDIPRGKHFDELTEHYNNIFSNETVNLIGFSLGGYIATYFAMRYPKRIKKLFVISNSPTSLSTQELTQRSDLLKYVQKYGYKGMSRKRIANLLDGPNQTDELIDFISEMDRDLGESQLLSQYQYTSERTDLTQAIKQFPFNAHFYYSEHDKMINHQWLSKLTHTKTNLSLISTAGSGHMLPLEKPHELANLINSWLES